MPEFKREERYVVLKVSDIAKYLNHYDKVRLADICCDIESARNGEGKTRLECVVVESDWPEYEPTWAAIEARVRAADMPSHRQRVVVEKAALDDKLAKLTAFIASEKFHSIVPSEAERKRLAWQREIMNDYSMILAERIAAFAE